MQAHPFSSLIGWNLLQLPPQAGPVVLHARGEILVHLRLALAAMGQPETKIGALCGRFDLDMNTRLALL